jgi:hypothetical protein
MLNKYRIIERCPIEWRNTYVIEKRFGFIFWQYLGIAKTIEECELVIELDRKPKFKNKIVKYYVK